MRKLAIVPATLLVLTAATHAQQPVEPLPPQSPQEQAPRVFRSSAQMVALNVTVTDGRKFVTGLGPGDFEIYEDGVRQHVRFFETSSVPMDVILLLDTSSSMRDRMPVVHEAARSFMKMLRPGDRGAVVAFNDNVRILQDLTSDGVAIESAINSTAALGGTAMHNAIYVALKQFGRAARRSGEVRRQALAVLSDGEDTSSLVSIEDVTALARTVGMNIYTIGLKSEGAAVRQAASRPFVSPSDYALRSLAKETGAQAFFPATIHELKTVYATIADELGAQYSIAYSPSNARLDGRFRRIVVRVASHPDFRPRARAGYTADRTTRAGMDGAHLYPR